jgi:dihydrofolate reductase
MGNVGAGFTMSLDGFIAGPNDTVERLFQWYSSGDTELKLPMGDHDLDLKLSSKSADVFVGAVQATGAIVSGRRMFDVAGAWGGRHPMDVPVFVVTHRVPQEWVKEGTPFTFVMDGVESAVAQAKKAAGEKNVGVGGADVARQCLKAGLLDEISVDLVPVLLGKGVRFFEYLGIEPVELITTEVIEAPDVVHLTFRVVK